MARILVVNSGSSSIKIQVIDTLLPAEKSSIAKLLVERIGEDQGRIVVTMGDSSRSDDSRIEDHRHGMQRALEISTEIGAHPADLEVQAIGHRVVHGGEQFREPVIVGAEVERVIEDLSTLAPLHNPANLTGIQVAKEMFPALPHVAVFDTAFFADMKPASYTYAIDAQIAAKWGLRRYGFHGTSHSYVSKVAADTLGRSCEEINQIVLHLGNGASISAIRSGVGVETSMGLTPLEGLVMGTRPGDIDPGVLLHLLDEARMSAAELSTMLNTGSGLKGLTGDSDFRLLLDKLERGDPSAQLAYDVVLHRIVHYIGGYWALLAKLDVVVFTAGVGENTAKLRADVIARFNSWGLVLDDEVNSKPLCGPTVISPPGAAVAVLVVPTNEELAIAEQAAVVGLEQTR